MSPAARRIVFETGNPGRLAVPGLLTVLMTALFGGIAAMLVATTWSLLPANPWLAAVWVAALFPLAVLWALKRLMARYALRVFADGAAEIVLPFKRVHIAPGALTAIARRDASVGNGLRRTWIDFAGPDGVHATVAARAFSPAQFDAFAAALRGAGAAVRVW